jgi:hypothetical protein
MTDDLYPEFEAAIGRMTAEFGPILGHQRAALGAERFARFTEGHATVQAMALFLVMSAMTVPQLGYSKEAIELFKQDARDLRIAANRWAKDCEQLAEHWQAQRQESER